MGALARRVRRRFGEGYLVEILTIITLSFFLFYTSFLDEAQQLMYQVAPGYRGGGVPAGPG
jgi:hypothetical protein